MLKLCDSNDFSVIERFCSAVNPFAAYVFCRVKSYGFSAAFHEAWIAKSGETVTAVLSSLNGNAVIYAAENADFEELSAFVRSFGFNTLLADSLSAERMGFDCFSQKQALVFTGECIPVEKGKEAELKETYSLLCECFPGEYYREKERYLEWLSDFTFRKKRNTARIKSSFDGGTLCASALTVAETQTCAVIGGVCCAESKRGQGFGKRTVLSLVSELKKENKSVFVFANRDVAVNFYGKIGFSFYENAAYIERRSYV